MLEANGFEPAVVAGTSAGSVVGALYASGMDAFQMQSKAVALDEASIRDVRLFSGGLVQGQKLQDYVNEQVANRPAERLKSRSPPSPPSWKPASAPSSCAAMSARPCAHRAASPACSNR